MANFINEAVNVNKVVIFIPPPVDAGPTPKNIKAIAISSEALLKVAGFIK